MPASPPNSVTEYTYITEGPGNYRVVDNLRNTIAYCDDERHAQRLVRCLNLGLETYGSKSTEASKP